MKKIMEQPVLVTRTFRNTNIITTSGDGIQLLNQQIDMSKEAQDAAAAKNGGVAVPAYGIQW